MRKIGVRELKQSASKVIQDVCETGETIAITRRGHVVAWLVAARHDETVKLEALQVWAEMDKLTREIADRWPAGMSAVDAVREQRREL